jgi:GrpB-like predicted nucleotidyltransferase (UPF0157 family)
MATEIPVEVVIAPYNSAWPDFYDAERAALQRGTGDLFDAVEHIGSTAVPGLAAKPIIDIAATVSNLDQVTGYLAPLHALGYLYVPEYEAVVPKRRYFRKGLPCACTCHLHIYPVGYAQWDRHIRFRDYLRAHPVTAQAYSELKQYLAVEHRWDRHAYTEAKTAFVRAVERAAGVSDR